MTKIKHLKKRIFYDARVFATAFNIYWSRPPIVMVYTAGKTTSTSTYYSLLRQYKGLVFRFHRHVEFEEKIKKNTRRIALCLECALMKRSYRYFVERPDDKIKLISLVREPIGRNISGFFHNHDKFWKTSWRQARQELKDGTLDMGALSLELKTLFLGKYPHEEKINWFDDQLKRYFGIDVYSKPFPETGHIRFKTDNGLELLLMRYDLDDRLKEKLIGDYVGIKDFHLQNYNIASDKEYGPIYAEFKQCIKLPAWYIEKMRASKYFTHFYSQEEIERVCAKWSDTTTRADATSRQKSTATS